MNMNLLKTYFFCMMNRILMTAGLALALGGGAARAAEPIRILTENTELVLQVAGNGRLYQTYLGERLRHDAEAAYPGRMGEVYSCSGNEDYFEPALALTHADGNPTTYLYYESSSTQNVAGGTETIIRLRDDKYPVSVTLHYVAYPKEDVIKTWSEVVHKEKKPVTLSTFASTMLYFDCNAYWLTEFSGDWAHEVNLSSQQLQYGKKVLDTKLGSRAGMHTSPFFQLGLGGPVEEHRGRVLMGTLGWTGNFRFTFEVDNVGLLRVIPAINPYASAYELEPGEVFRTPEFIFTLSAEGTGRGSRNLHDWARRYQLKDGTASRLTLLNNWENTGFNFNEARLAELMQEARKLGVDMFLLDDGWFGNKYPRSNDRAGLGDWQPTQSKLPGGIPALVQAAEKAGVRFGIWIEPEMVNPKSELFEKHPEWVIHQPNRKAYYYRNQLVLDLANPKVQDYVYGVVEGILKENSQIKYFKWDCNSPITNIYSPYLKERQGRLYIDYVRGLYNVLERIRQNYPDVQMMLCSGGGARCDYEALKYFTEFWCSDNTDPVERLFIQWGFSQFFPAKAMCAHVTNWNRSTSVKFRTDVASMCKLGFDINLSDMNERDFQYCQTAVANWKRLQPVIMEGRQYRLVSPYEGEHMAVNYVDEARRHAVLFAYDIHPRFQDHLLPVRLEGLDPERMYLVEEINLMPGAKPSLSQHGRTLSGDYLMKVGLNVLSGSATRSHVVELTAQ